MTSRDSKDAVRQYGRLS